VSTQSNITASDGWFIGEDKTLRFLVVDGNGAAQNIAGWTMDFKLSATLSGDRIFTKTVGAGISLTSPSGGIADVQSDAADTLGLTPGTFYYVLRRTNAGFHWELAFGTAVLLDVEVNYSP
jgi:hypothetical protein